VRGAVAKMDAYRAISDPTRRAVLDLLAQGERSVTELCEPFAMSQPALSQHLKVLRDAGLVATRRFGRQRIYRLDPRPLRTVLRWVTHYERFWDDKLTALGRYLDETAGKGRP
jgi:DNA-binding transcriptional ArsR family regulator